MLRDSIMAAAVSCIRPRATEPIWEWASREVFLPAKAKASAGFYDWRETPYNRLVMDFAQSDEWDECIIKKSSRTGPTEAVLNVVRWMPQHWPGHVLYAINSADEARDIMEDRIEPTIRKAAGEEVTDDPDDMGTYRIDLRSMRIRVAGGGSKGVFANKWLRLGVLDEVEEHPINQRAAAGGSTIDLMRTRFQTVPGAKMYVIGNPGLKGGLLDREHASGSCHVYLVPCPHCGHEQELTHKSLIFGHCKDLAGEWDMQRVMDEVYYRCSGCGGRIQYDQLYEMNLAGRWESTNPKHYPRRMSLHISDLYSPYMHWGQLAMMIIEASGNDSKRQKVWNKNLGLAYEPRMMSRTETDIMRLRAGVKDEESGGIRGKPYIMPLDPMQREIPIRPKYLLTYIDIQQASRKVVVGAYDEDMALWIVDYGEPIDDATLERDFLDRSYRIAGTDEEMRIQTGWRDCGERWTEQIEWCLATFDRYHIYPARGEKPKRGPIVWSQAHEHKGRMVEVYWYQDERLKEELYLDRIARLATPRIWMPTNLDEHPELVHELTTEQRFLEIDKWGNPRWKWGVKSGAKNDYGDGLKGLIGMGHILAAAAEG